MSDRRPPIIVSENPVVDLAVTIPLAEYHYLTRIDALMDVLINDDSYRKMQTVEAVVASAKAMRGMNDEAVGLE